MTALTRGERLDILWVSIAGGSSQVGDMNDIDASYEFTSLGRTCMITSVQHAAVPERTEQSC